SLTVVPAAVAERYLAQAGLRAGARVQFERLGYFCLDLDSAPGKQVWNRTVSLKDSWAKLEGKAQAGKPPVGTKPTPSVKPAAALPPSSPPPKVPAPAVQSAPPGEIGIEDFGRVDLRVGIVREAAHVPEAQKLIRLLVDLGEARPRQIFTGLRADYPDPTVLIGQRVVVVANLKKRQMKFGLSEGMILSAGGGDRPHRIVTFGDAADAPVPGDKIG
ncbi:MAG: hypothetical protein ABUS79_00740, partial [Pseudomonadota bacterium]